MTDPLGRTSQLLEYSTPPTLNTPADTFSGVFTVTGGTPVTSTYGYDGHGNQHRVTDTDGNMWTSTYNLLGQVTARTDPDAGTTTGMTYDGNGNLLQSTDSRGRTTSHTYDALNRKTGRYAATIASQTPANQLASWVYDNANNAIPNMRYPIGQLTTTTAYWDGNPYTTQQRGFNVFGKPIGQTVTIPTAEGLLAGAYTFAYVYTTTTGLLGRSVYPGRGGLPAETVNHFYTGGFDLPSVVGGLAGYADGTSYDAWARTNQVTIGTSPNWAYITNSYDDHTGRLTQQLVTRAAATPAEIDRQHYQYDPYGNVTRQTSTRLASTSTSETQCFEYDDLQRLTQAWTATDDCAATPTPTSRSTVGSNLGPSSAYWTSWQFDLIGNRTEQTRYSTSGGSDTTTTYTRDGNGAGQPHTLTGTTTTGATTTSHAYGYDDAGNMTSRDAGGGNQTLTWNDAGQLAAIDGSTTGDSIFLYDADGNLLLQKDPGATTLYLPGQQHTLNTTTQAVTGARYYALPGGTVCIRTGTGTNYTFAITDRQGTPTLYLDNTAQTPTWRQYTPYGAPRGATTTPPDNRGFLGKTENTTTGLTRLGARDYDPTTGQFISVDPIQDMGDPQQWNGYSYANNNPITMSDPDGLRPLATNTVQEDDAGGGGKHETTDQKGSCSSIKSCERGHDRTSSWGNTPLAPKWNANWATALKRLFPSRCSGGSDNRSGCGGPAAWMVDAVRYGAEAGVDPRLVLSVLMAEVGNSENWDPLDRRLQLLSVAADKLGVYGPIKNIVGWVTGFKKGEGYNPPSIGWGNIQEGTFNEVKGNHPEALGSVDWTDLIADPSLSIKVTAYALADYQALAEKNAPDGMRAIWTPQQVAAGIYNIGPDNYNAARSRGRFGPRGSTYTATIGRYMQASDQLICESGVFSC
ncbi:RHS repeat-associated core domain-containing protein [Solwaraspora sp. WMMA2080]|uniref:RHS repeat-associated core domain-containing protein n=1 Tax=unclassified Solwaraspora TaxID=2627926 RepID=UPI00248C8FBC|nr:MULTISPECIES: RHS repeat-associated core domain-containing protein [unclassified Solwaraspora]WBB96725.1 RHS repeat-associated core domain-containing protein [Solwaraspora sp. WMMA2059]WBC19371.1 RHS repeat-associated core domain-containing protein [Solwaraspora sp. WMMA2080]